MDTDLVPIPPHESPDVLFLTFDRRIDRRTLQMRASLAEAGLRCCIYAMPTGTDEPQNFSVVRLNLDSSPRGRENTVARTYLAATKLLAGSPALLQQLKKAAWAFVVKPDEYYDRLFWPHIRNMRPRVVVAVDLPMLPVASRLADAANAKLVYDSHELYSEQNFSLGEKAKWARIEKSLINRCHAVITVNQSIAVELARRYGVSQPEVVLNAERNAHPPEPSRYFHELWGLPDCQRILLYQGGMSVNRGIENLVLAMSKLKSLDLTLVLMGEGELEARLKKLIHSNGVSANVKQHPAVAQDKLLSVTAAADAGVIPYLPDCLNSYYCTPNKLFEYIAAGRPILANDLPELRRFIVEKDLGIVGDMSSPEKSARLIEDFFACRSKLDHFSANSLALRQELNWEVEAEKVVQIFTSLI